MRLESALDNYLLAKAPYSSPSVTDTIAAEHLKILTFSNAIASAKDKHMLAVVLKNQLKQLFQIEDYAIYAFSDDRKSYHAVLQNLNGYFTKHRDFKLLANTEANINEPLFSKIFDSEGPFNFSSNEWFYSKKQFNLHQSKSDKKIMAIPIRLGEENIAIMNFIQEEFNPPIIQRHIFRCICSQIAVTVANIVANEKLNKQLVEITMYKDQLDREKTYLKEEIQTSQNYSEIIGSSPEMLNVFQLVARVAPSASTVLILGETGTGKELIARAIHNASSRKDKLMVKVNCAALPANLIESELFGHERGSFTGAMERKIGKFELANGGTIFLDEIGEMPLDLQVKLLRVLQEREIERVGGKITLKVDVRIIAATNRDLENEMQEGRFRNDLYYRLNVFPICLPSLRDRRSDIPQLASYFINHFANKSGKKLNNLSQHLLQELIQYNWPGNIRELEHVIERSVLLSSGDTIKQINLPSQRHNTSVSLNFGEFATKTIDENERDHILATIAHCKGKITGNGGAARLLSIPPSTLNSKMKKLGIKRMHSA
jgi:formate hydrogenlyase transcriptional activator